jgi:serine phosphatase RsbU (regulator of sigma subunit)
MASTLRGDGNVLGVLEFFGPDLRPPDGELLPLLTGLGSQIAQFIERRHAERVVQARAREFSLARTIQQGLLPKAPPALPGLEIAGASHPAPETGGDYFDFIPMSDGHWGIAIGDASGHGIGAALLVAETRAYLRALALTHTDPGQVLDEESSFLWSLSPSPKCWPSNAETWLQEFPLPAGRSFGLGLHGC